MFVVKMVSIIKYDCKPDINSPIFIEGLPGVGSVGKIAADFVASKLDSKRMAVIYSDDLPPQVFIDEDSISSMASNELWYVKGINKHDLIFLLGNSQGVSPRGQCELSRFAFKTIIKYDPHMIITLGGYGVGNMVSNPRVIGAISNQKIKPKIEDFGVQFIPGEPLGGVIGAAAFFLGLGCMYNIDSLCIMGETSGYIMDYKSARNLVNVIGNIIGIKFDTLELQSMIDKVDDINKKAQTMLVDESKSYLSYIG